MSRREESERVEGNMVGGSGWNFGGKRQDLRGQPKAPSHPAIVISCIFHCCRPTLASLLPFPSRPLVASELFVGLNSSVMVSAAEQPGLRQRKDERGVSSAQESSNSGLDVSNGERAPEKRSSVSRSLSSLNTSDLLIPLSLVFGGCCS